MNKLKEKVKWILEQTGDYPCWMDWGILYKELAELCDMKNYQPKLLPKDIMLRNCERFIDSLTKDTEYNKDQLASDLLNEIEEAFKIAGIKLYWNAYTRRILSEAIDKVLRRYNGD